VASRLAVQSRRREAIAGKEAHVATSNPVHAVDAMSEVAVAARNDEILEVTMFLFELLAERAENALELAVDSGDRDALNEVCVFATRADEMTPWGLSGPNRVRKATRRLQKVQDTALAEIEAARSSSGGPEPATKAKPIELNPWLLDDQELVDAVGVATEQWAAWHAERGSGRRTTDIGAREVARVLAGKKAVNDPCPEINHGDVIRIGQRLGKLSREGKIRLASKRWEGRGYAPVEADDA
jgi:hypothetical protein